MIPGESLKRAAGLGRVAGSWSSGYDIALTWRRSPVRIRSSPLLSMQVNFLSELRLIGCSAATCRGERLSMRAEIRGAYETPELDGVGASCVHCRRRRIGGPRMPVLPKPTELRVCGRLRRVHGALGRGAPPEVTGPVGECSAARLKRPAADQPNSESHCPIRAPL